MTITGKGARRTRRSPQERRRQLLDLGRELAAEASLENVTIEKVAERAGVSRALIFHYFASKQDFHQAIVREQIALMVERTAPPDDVEDPIAMLSSSMEAYLDYVEEYADDYVGVLRGTLSADPALRQVVDEARLAMIRRILERVPVLGLEVTPAVQLAVQSWIAFVEDVVVRWVAEKDVTREQVHGILVGSLPALAGAASLVN